nr:PGF-pre-PGF domain-containing protein [Halarchaeum solikamskense]
MRYFVLNATGVSDANVSEATIRFRVAPVDLPNGTGPSDVALYRYHDASWGALPTEHLNGSAYAATTPGFSAFAIGSTNATAAENASETTANETTSTSSESHNGTATVTTATTNETTTSTVTSTASSTSTSSGSSPGFGPAVAALAFALAAYLLRRR